LFKILVDLNLSHKISNVFRNENFHFIHVSDIGCEASDDIFLWRYAVENRMHLLTKDKDFKNIQVMHGFPPKIIWIRKGNCSTQEIIELIDPNLTHILYFLDKTNIGTLEIN